jgi:hypothetical protein
MAVDTNHGAAQSTQLALFDETLLHISNCAADELRNDTSLRFLFIQTEILNRASRLSVMDRPTLDDAQALVVAQFSSIYGNERTLRKYVAETSCFFDFLRYCDLRFLDEVSPVHVDDFIWSASRRRGRTANVSARTAANRQGILRAAFECLRSAGVWAGADLVGPVLPRPTGDSARPLTEQELHRVRLFAESGLFVSGRAMLVALAEAGATAEEIARVYPSDVDLIGGTVQLRGRAPRVNRLTPWATSQLCEGLARHRGDGPVCVSADLPIDRAAHSVTVRLGAVIADAGLGGVPRVSARSIRLGRARSIFESDGLIAAARFLGDQSLDATAASINYRWWDV